MKYQNKTSNHSKNKTSNHSKTRQAIIQKHTDKVMDVQTDKLNRGWIKLNRAISLTKHKTAR